MKVCLCYLSTGEVKPLTDPDDCLSAALDTAMLWRQTQTVRFMMLMMSVIETLSETSHRALVSVPHVLLQGATELHH